MVVYLMLISYMTKMMMLFSLIIVVGLFLTWVNDGLEHLLARFRRPQPSTDKKVTVAPLQSRQLIAAPARPRVKAIAIPKSVKVLPPLADIPPHDYAGKIVKIDLAPRSRPSNDEHGEKLGEHVTVLPKAA